MKLAELLSIIFVLFALLPKAHARCDWPQSSKSFPLTASSGISRQTYLSDLALIQKTFAPLVKSKGGTLMMVDAWGSDEVNAQAYRAGHTWYVESFGGLARYPGMTRNGHLLVLCHELGHHLGGAPKYDANTDWASVEGEADYYATLVCFKTLGLASTTPSLTLTKILAELSGERAPSRSSRDMSQVSSTEEGHPRAQCRLDTMDAGRQCPKHGPLSNTDPRTNACYSYKDGRADKGDRPRCWLGL